MTDGLKAIAARYVAKVLVVTALVAGATQIAGLSRAADSPASHPATAVVAVPAASAKPVAPAPAVVPVAAPAEAPFVVRRVLAIDGPFEHGDYVWDEDGAPGAGPLVITVDLAAQVLSVFRDGYEIGAAVILYGDTDKPTPLGVFPITQKDADHVSNLYGAPMPYMLRLTNDGISIHGSEVNWNYATHGCIGVPVAFAKKLFGATRLGDKVIVTNGERLQIGQAITAA